MSEQNLKEADQSTNVLLDEPVTGAAEGAKGEVYPETLPVLPVRGIVLFPGMMAPLTVQRSSSLQMLEETVPENRWIGVITQKDESLENPDEADLYRVGTLAKVMKLLRQDDSRVVILLQVRERIRVNEICQMSPYVRVNYEILKSHFPEDPSDHFVAAVRNLRDTAVQLIKSTPGVPPEAEAVIQGMDDAGALTDFLAGNLGIDLNTKQELLEELEVVRRVDGVQEHLDNQLRISQLQQKLRADVETEFSDQQRRAYLRQQLRSIQKELGEDEGSEEQVEDLSLRLEEAGLSDVAMKQADRELKRLEVIPPASPEHSVITTYLETLAELPWKQPTDTKVDLKEAEEILNRDHFGLEKVKRRILEYLAVRQLNPEGRGPILCFVGPPGVGKTSLGQSIADALGRDFARISVGGLRDESEIRGHRRTYIGSMPGRLIQELRRVGTRNPVLMLDEVDKIGSDFRGDPASALLEVLDPRQNHSFVDRYLDVPFDLSQVIFIATANTMDPVPGPLRDRMEVIEIPGYTMREKLAIALNYLVERQRKENGLKPEQCLWTEAALVRVIEEYTREAGVRNLERQIGSVSRSIAAKVARGEEDAVEVTVELVEEILGPPVYLHEENLADDEVGVVTGLAYTPSGGEVLHIEAIRYTGDGGITLTGQIGDVMKESVKAALSLVKSRAEKLGIDPELFKTQAVHVHVPAGAIPKDGPSAGIAMFTALASLFSGRQVRHDVAMTGEVTLRGRVLPIGGLKEKSLAALRAGTKTVIIPFANEKDLPDIPAEAREQLKFVPVKTVDEVLEIALMPQEDRAS